MTKYLSLLPFFAVVAVVSLTGTQFMPGDWYAALNKPSFTPPGWLFGPVWTLLYIFIAIAGWLVWRKEGLSALLVIWFVQLAFNVAWPWIMFGREEIGLALVDILAMLAAIIAFVAVAWTRVPTAAYLFLPYLAWVAFATLLNFRLWQLNAAAT